MKTDADNALSAQSLAASSLAALAVVNPIDNPAPAVIDLSDVQTIDFDELFSLYMAENQKVWEHDRRSTLGASEVFDCLRKGWYEKRGTEFSIEPDEDYDDDYGAMERGNLIENYFAVPALRLALPKLPTLPPGVKILLSGSDQKTVVLDRNSATPDGLIFGLTSGPLCVRGGGQDIYIPDIKSNCIVLELKSVDPRAVLLEERVKHHNQTQVQLGLIREVTPYKPVYAIVLYIDASFLSKVTPFVVEFKESIYVEAKQRAADVWRVSDPMMVTPEGRFSDACKHCRWRGPCGSTTIASIPNKLNKPQSPKAIQEMDPLARAYLDAKATFEVAETELKKRAEAIKESLLDNKVSQLAGATWKVTWFPVKGKLSLDREAVKAAGIDLEPFMKEGNGHEQLRVTPQLEKKPKSPKNCIKEE